MLRSTYFLCISLSTSCYICTRENDEKSYECDKENKKHEKNNRSEMDEIKTFHFHILRSSMI